MIGFLKLELFKKNFRKKKQILSKDNEGQYLHIFSQQFQRFIRFFFIKNSSSQNNNQQYLNNCENRYLVTDKGLFSFIVDKCN